MSLERLHSKAKTYKIGKDLPEEEKTEIKLWSLSIEDTHLGEALPDDAPIAKKQERIIQLLAKLMRIDEEDVKKIDIAFLEEIMECVEDRLQGSNKDIGKKITEMKERLAHAKQQ